MFFSFTIKILWDCTFIIMIIINFSKAYTIIIITITFIIIPFTLKPLKIIHLQYLSFPHQFLHHPNNPENYLILFLLKNKKNFYHYF